MRITAPHFVAGIILDENGVVVRAAPILRYMLNWSRRQVRHYCLCKHWKVEDDESPGLPPVPRTTLG